MAEVQQTDVGQANAMMDRRQRALVKGGVGFRGSHPYQAGYLRKDTE
jgi:hypothetical protein